jgi:hypothetical protein
MPKAEKCGHINRHSIGVDGKPDNLECTLDSGHPGAHSAPHHEIAKQLSGTLEDEDRDVFETKYDEQGELYYEGHPLRSWTDAAGIPAKEIKPVSPGLELVNRPDLFPEQQAAEMAEMKQQLAELKALLAEK